MPPLSPPIPEEISLSFQLTRGRISEAATQNHLQASLTFLHLFHVLGAQRLIYTRPLRGRFIDKIIIKNNINNSRQHLLSIYSLLGTVINALY